MTYDEAVRALGFDAGDSFESHLPVLRDAEARLEELAASATDEVQRRDYSHQLEMLREAMAVVERGPEPVAAPVVEDKRPRKSGGARLLASLVVVLVLVGLGWGGAKFVNRARAANEAKRMDAVLAEGYGALENRKWPEAEAKFAEVLAVQPGRAEAVEGMKKVEEGIAVARRQQIAYLAGTAQSSIESREWDKATTALDDLEELEPEHELIAASRERIKDGRIYDQIAGLIEKSEEAIQEERWDELTTHAAALEELAPLHVDLPRYRQLSEEGLKLMAEHREQARNLYEEAKSLDDGVYSDEALEKVREAMRLDRQPEYQALYDKLSEYRRVLKVPEGFPTIAEAVAAARPDDTIRVAEGTYEESLILEHRISLEGAGRDKTVIACPAERASVITVRAGVEGGRIEGFTLQQSGFVLTRERFPILAVGQGTVTVEDCHLEKGSGHGIAVLDGGAVRLRDVRVSQCGWDGLAVHGEGSHAEVESCRFDANIHHGIDAWDGGTVTMRKSRCSANGLTGAVLMSSGKQFLVEQCTLDANREVGLMVTNGAQADLISNQVTANLLGGVLVRDNNTTVKMRGNQVSKNHKVGIMVDEQSMLAAFEKNVVEGNIGKQAELSAEIAPKSAEAKRPESAPSEVAPAPAP